MGLPMVQVFMIIARQMSKPVADLVMRYGKNHSLFRNKLLIPVGRGLVNLTTRLRMKNLGLGAPTTVANVSESAALEQASEFVQQVVIFGYTVGVFYSYQVYSKSHENPSASREDVIRLEKDLNSRLGDLNQQVEMLNREIKKLSETQNSWSVWRWFSSSSPKSNNINEVAKRRASSAPVFSTSMSREEALKRISDESFESST